MGDLYEFEDVDAFTTGAVGSPGQRTFYVQIRGDGRRVTLKCEKQQVDALSQYLHRLLNDLPVPHDRPRRAVGQDREGPPALGLGVTGT